MVIKMNNRKKVAIFMALAIVAGFSSFEFYTSPSVTGEVWKQNLENYDLLSATNTSTEVNLTQSNQEITAGFYVDAKKAPWNENDSFYMTIYVVKFNQSVSFPYTDATAVVGNVSVQANGTVEKVHDAGVGIRQVRNSSVIAHYFLVEPQKTTGPAGVTISFDIHSVLFSGIYYFPGPAKHVSESFHLS